ncbi:MAG: putative rane protein [Acidobacteriota bacterium]|jgi:putative membrane protein|nr:putative rane protein [Acidobacteriota bacterium]
MSKNTFSGAILISGACALLAFVVVAAGASGAQNSNSSTMGNMNASGKMSHGSGQMMADHKFAMEAAMGGMEEVQLGRIAAQKGASEEVRQFGQRMVDDHSKANDDLMQVASGKGMTLPTALAPKMQADVQKLSAMSGEKFDKEYVKMMVKDHKKDVGEFQKEAKGGMDADIKSFAARTLPTLQEHLQMIQRINDKMMMRKSGNLKSANANANM